MRYITVLCALLIACSQAVDSPQNIPSEPILNNSGSAGIYEESGGSQPIGGSILNSGGFVNISGSSGTSQLAGQTGSQTGGNTSDESGGAAGLGYTDDGVGSTGGNTEDNVGGSGLTDDGVGGSGLTDDGSGGVGNTDDGSGGVGNTDDNTGGVGNTDDNTGGLAGTPDGPPPCMPTFMDSINTLVFENATLSGADTEGRLFIGGDAILDWTVGAALEHDCSRRDLIVGGDLTWNSGSAPNGMVSVGGDLERSIGVGMGCGFEQNEDAFDFETAEQELTEYSQNLLRYPENGVVSNNYGALYLTGTNPEVNVFYLDQADLSGIHTIELDVPDNSAVIINVSGTDITFSSFGFGTIGECKGGGTECHQIIWNLYEAETVTISGVGMQGTVLAPLAAVDFSNGMIDGQLIVRSLTGSGEHHPYMFTGCYEVDL